MTFVKPTADFIPSPNFTRIVGRKITAIVIHYTGSMTVGSTVSWFQQTKQQELRVSAHYIVAREGYIVQMVKNENIAWHAGVSKMPSGQRGVNNFSIGIELVGTMDSGFTDVQMMSLYHLLEWLVQLYNIEPSRVVGHKQIAPGRKIDPDGPNNQFNWVKVKEVVTRAYEMRNDERT